MISGKYFEAGNSRSVPATLDCQGNSLVLVIEGRSRLVDPDTVEISQRLARLARRLQLPDGSMFSTLENQRLDEMLKSMGLLPASSLISYFETGWRWTLLALLVIPTVLYLLFTVGMPLVAKPLAIMVPQSVKQDLDQQAIEFLDQWVFAPSTLTSKRKTEIGELVRYVSVVGDTELIFRHGGKVGAGAFALPGGTIVFTDQLVGLSDQEGELLAVYAHEVGHVVNNHSLRNVMQTAGVTFVLGWMLGDLTMITDIVLVGAPALLQQMTYSRKFEHEADLFALRQLDVWGYSRNCFADVMEKLATQVGDAPVDLPDYLSSHPPPGERIAMARSDRPCAEHRSNRKSNKPASRQSRRTKIVPPFAPGKVPRPQIIPNEQMVSTEYADVENRDYAPTRKVPPVYPRVALMAEEEGYCVVEYTVTRFGTVSKPEIVEDECTSSLFHQASLEAALKFRYSPRIVDFEAVDVPGVQNRFTYTILPRETNTKHP